MEIQKESFGFRTVSLCGDNGVCIIETHDEKKDLAVIDFKTEEVNKKPTSAESVILHPSKKIIALRARTQMQIVDLENKERLKEGQIPEQIELWKWINEYTIGIIGEVAVYHWGLDDDQPPRRIFERRANLVGSQIINYMSDSEGKWLMLTGILARDGRFIGSIQLYSTEKNSGQIIESTAGAIGDITMDIGDVEVNMKIFAFVARGVNDSKLHLVCLENDKPYAPYKKKVVDMYFPEDQPSDFPITVHINSIHNMVFILTKSGYFHMYDLYDGVCLFMNKITKDTIFITSGSYKDESLWMINRSGHILSIGVNQDSIVPYILKQLGDPERAMRISGQNSLPGTEDIAIKSFNESVEKGDGLHAAMIAVKSSSGVLRTAKTIEVLKTMPMVNNKSPLLEYFGKLMSKGALNEIESIEIVKPAISQGKFELIEKWLSENKLGCSEELGDLLLQVNHSIALSVYVRAEVPKKAVECFIKLGMYHRICSYCERTGYIPEYKHILIKAIEENADQSVSFAKEMTNSNSCNMSPLDIAKVYETENQIPQATSYLLDILTSDVANEKELQTYCLVLNIKYAPQVAEAIMDNEIFTKYDKKIITQLCEESGMINAAILNAEDYDDIKRLMKHGDKIEKQALLEIFSKLSPKQCVECFCIMLATPSQTDMVCSLAHHYTDSIGALPLIKLFSEMEKYDALYNYVGRIGIDVIDKQSAMMYIKALISIGRHEEAINFLQNNNEYDATEALSYLKSANILDKRAYIAVCDKQNMITELVDVLYNEKDMKSLYGYIKTVDADKVNAILKELLRRKTGDEIISEVFTHIDDMDGKEIEKTVSILESYGKLKLALPWLEDSLKRSQSTDPGIHTALGMIYIDTNTDPKTFLAENKYYDAKVLGGYLEKSDIEAATIAYEKDHLDDDFLRVTKKSGLYRRQAKYLLRRKDLGLWKKVLDVDDVHREEMLEALVNEVGSWTKGENKNIDLKGLSIAAKELLNHNFYKTLESILSSLLLTENTDTIEALGNSQGLQNLLFMTVLQVTDENIRERVLEYIRKLDKYDPHEVVQAMLAKGHPDLALLVYEKRKQHRCALDLIMRGEYWETQGVDINDLYHRAIDYTNKYGKEDPELKRTLADKQVQIGKLDEAIATYIEIGDADGYAKVLEAEKESPINKDGFYKRLLSYLQMVQDKLQERSKKADSGAAYCLCRLGRYEEVESALHHSNDGKLCVDWKEVVERCYKEERYLASKQIYEYLNNYEKVAEIYLKLKDYPGAVMAAKKAGSIEVWREIAMACIDVNEMHLAQASGLYLCSNVDGFRELIGKYERSGHIEELIELMEAAFGTDGCYQGFPTDLAIIYSRYAEEKLYGHLKRYASKCILDEMVKELEDSWQWKELCLLYKAHKEYEQSMKIIIRHSGSVWNEEQFHDYFIHTKDTMIIAILDFYLAEHPLLLDDLLKSASALDHSKVIEHMSKKKQLPLIRGYLQSHAYRNAVVGRAYCQVVIDEGDWRQLLQLAESGPATHMKLADGISTHEKMEFRVVAAKIYKEMRNWRKAYDIYKGIGWHKHMGYVVFKSRAIELGWDYVEHALGKDNPYMLFMAMHVGNGIVPFSKILETVWQWEARGSLTRISTSMLTPCVIDMLEKQNL